MAQIDPIANYRNMSEAQLIAQLTGWDDAYYNGSGIVSDSTYDLVRDFAKAAYSGNPYFNKTGAPVAQSGGTWPSVRHPVLMSSLEKVKPTLGDDPAPGADPTKKIVLPSTELAAWYRGNKLANSTKFQVMLKLDGSSCFDGETQVHLANGETLSIQEIFEQNLAPRVLTWDEKRGVTTESVVKVHDNGIKNNWVRLTFEDKVLHLSTSVVVTEDHLFKVKGKGWVQAKDLQGEDLQDLEDPLNS